jgi:Uma2 family endonuclease
MDPGDKKRRATYQDVIDAPENMTAEIINGELHLWPRPFSPHQAVASALGDELGPPFKRGRGGPGGWIILDEAELHLGDDVLVPDLSGWRRERMPVVPERHIALPPDWVCEVISKSRERYDRIEKMPVYAAAGVKFMWLVHPLRRTLETFRLHDGKWLLLGAYKDDDRARIEPFDAIEFDIASLWLDTPLPTRASELAADYDYAD